jgi:hypothetical protein
LRKCAQDGEGFYPFECEGVLVLVEFQYIYCAGFGGDVAREAAYLERTTYDARSSRGSKEDCRGAIDRAIYTRDCSARESYTTASDLLDRRRVCLREEESSTR